MNSKRVLLVCIMMALYHFGYTQKIIQKTFYKTQDGNEIQDTTKAKFVHLRYEDVDGSLHYEEKEIKSGKILLAYQTLHDEPVGIWIYNDGRQFDYRFDLVYQPKKYHEVDTLKDQVETVPVDSSLAYTLPEFPGGKNGLMQFLGTIIRYPLTARDNNIQGRVVVQFMVDQQGIVKYVSVFKSIHPALDKEAVRIVRNFPRWIPAQKEGKPVNAFYILPVSFRLQD